MIVFFGSDELVRMGTDLVTLCIIEWLHFVKRIVFCSVHLDEKLFENMNSHVAGDVVFCNGENYVRLKKIFRVDFTPCVFEIDKGCRITRVGVFGFDDSNRIDQVEDSPV